MAFEYTPTPTNWATITMPSPGDNRVAASVDLPMSQILDKIEWTRRGSQIAGATINATQGNFTAAGWASANVWRVAASANVLFNGFDSTEVGLVKLKLFVNASAFVVSIGHGTGAAGNQCICPTAATFVLGPGDSCYLWYDDTSTAWRVISTPRGGNYVWGGTHIFNANPVLGAASELAYFSPRQRVSMMPLISAIEGTSWSYSGGYMRLISASTGSAMVPIRLPTGAVMTGVLAGITGVDGSNTITLAAYKDTHNILGVDSTRTQIGNSDAGGTTGDDTLSVGTVAETIDNAVTAYYARFTTTNIALQAVRWLAVMWNDVSVVNY